MYLQTYICMYIYTYMYKHIHTGTASDIPVNHNHNQLKNAFKSTILLSGGQAEPGWDEHINKNRVST